MLLSTDYGTAGWEWGGFLGSSAIAQVVRSPNGVISGHAGLGDYSRHRFRVVYNCARDQRASDANPRESTCGRMVPQTAQRTSAAVTDGVKPHCRHSMLQIASRRSREHGAAHGRH